MAVVKCPECGKSLKVSDNLAGKRVRCPGCKNPITVPAPDAPVLELAEDEEEEGVTAQPRRNAARSAPPRRSRDDDEDEEDEEEEDDRPRRRRRSVRRDVSVSSGPLVYGILSCLLSCAPLIGAILGSLAIKNANEEMDRLPRGRAGDAGRKQLQLAKILGIVGICLSVLMLILAVVFNIATSKH